MLSGMTDAPTPSTSQTAPPAIEPIYPIQVPAGSSHLYGLVQDRLATARQGDLAGFIRVRRMQLPKPIPYYLIAHELSTLVDYNVTHESVRRWDQGLGKGRRAAASTVAEPA